MKIIFGSLAAFMLAAVLLASPAEARCWQTPYGVRCGHPHYYWHAHPYWHPHPYWHHHWRRRW